MDKVNKENKFLRNKFDMHRPLKGKANKRVPRVIKPIWVKTEIYD